MKEWKKLGEKSNKGQKKIVEERKETTWGIESYLKETNNDEKAERKKRNASKNHQIGEENIQIMKMMKYVKKSNSTQ